MKRYIKCARPNDKLILFHIWSGLAKVMKTTVFYILFLILVVAMLVIQNTTLFKQFVAKLQAEETFKHADVRTVGDQSNPTKTGTERPASKEGAHEVITSSTTNKSKQEDFHDGFRKQSEISKEVTHIAFLKVHKAASTTVQAVLQRFGLRRNLSFVIADASHYISKQKHFFSDIWPPLPTVVSTNQISQELNVNNKYDIMCNHMVFNHKKVSRLLHDDAKYIAIVREPMKQFLSAAFYYKFVWNFPYLEKLPNETFITDLIRKPYENEATTMAESMTYNSMAYDFGLDFGTLKEAEEISDRELNMFIKNTGDTFHLVMLVEKFDESLVLLKRYLKWSLEDVVYVKSNTFLSGLENNTIEDFKLSTNDTNLFKKRNKFDYALYDLFKDRLEKQISAETGFEEEVVHFKNILRDVQEFCIGGKKRSTENSQILSKTEKGEGSQAEKVLEKKVIEKKALERNQEQEYKVKKKEFQNENVTAQNLRNIKTSDQGNLNNSKEDGQTRKGSEGQNKDLVNLVNTIVQTKMLTEEQENELIRLPDRQDNEINRWNIDNLSIVLSWLFYEKNKTESHQLMLRISESKWNKEFYVTTDDCKLLTLDELERYRVVKEYHLKHIVRLKFGDNFSVNEALNYVFTFY